MSYGSVEPARTGPGGTSTGSWAPVPPIQSGGGQENAAETTLSSLPNTAPRISTSSSNITGEDVCRVIHQYLTSSPNRALAGVGAGRGSMRRPTKRSTGRGQGLAGMIAESVSAGRG